MGNNNKNNKQKLERLYNKGVNNKGSYMTIVEYTNATNIKVRFDDGYATNSTYRQFIRGEIRNPYDKTVYNIGYLGEGNSKVKTMGKCTKQYRTWHGMMSRCYNDNFLTENITYSDCIVSEEWHNFQKFAKWYDQNYYEIDGEIMHLDKDILYKGNKIYSENTCAFVPQSVNVLFIKRQNRRGKYPIGVSEYKLANNRCNYIAVVNDEHGKQLHIGIYDTVDEAFLSYKAKKEYIIKQTADKYKKRIPEILYNAMCRYQVEIND